MYIYIYIYIYNRSLERIDSLFNKYDVAQRLIIEIA